MRRYLLVVDLQKEFVRDFKGKRIYNNCLKYIEQHRSDYHAVIAAVYVNNSSENPNMQRLLGWTEMECPEDLDFIPDAKCLHSGYSISQYPHMHTSDEIDVIGFDTDACVLSACFDLFNKGVKLNILINGVWSSGGEAMHKAALKIMDRQFGKAVRRDIKL